jgi:hypothetical protein
MLLISIVFASYFRTVICACVCELFTESVAVVGTLSRPQAAFHAAVKHFEVDTADWQNVPESKVQKRREVRKNQSILARIYSCGKRCA